MCTGAGLDDVDPGGSLDEVIFLEIVGEGFDEFFGRNVLDGEEGLLLFSQHGVVKNIKILFN